MQEAVSVIQAGVVEGPWRLVRTGIWVKCHKDDPRAGPLGIGQAEYSFFEYRDHYVAIHHDLTRNSLDRMIDEEDWY